MTKRNEGPSEEAKRDLPSTQEREEEEQEEEEKEDEDGDEEEEERNAKEEEEETNLVDRLSREEYQAFRKEVIELIVHTDMTKHFSLLALFKVKRQTGTLDFV